MWVSPSYGAVGGVQLPTLQPTRVHLTEGVVPWWAGWGEERAGQRELSKGMEYCGGSGGWCFIWEVESKWETGNHESLAN